MIKMLLDFSADRTAVSDKMKETVFDLCQGLPLKIINLPKTNTTTNKTSGQTSSGLVVVQRMVWRPRHQ